MRAGFLLIATLTGMVWAMNKISNLMRNKRNKEQ